MKRVAPSLLEKPSNVAPRLNQFTSLSGLKVIGEPRETPGGAFAAGGCCYRREETISINIFTASRRA
jgi:hypothetical protein